jgi:DNA gyrase/topoisomerase IV subunit B
MVIAEKRVNVLMGDNSQIRKEWIDANVNFDLTDN